MIINCTELIGYIIHNICSHPDHSSMAQTEDNTYTMMIFVKFRTSLNINRFAKCNYAVFIVVMVHDLKNVQMIWYFTCQLSQMTNSHVGTRQIVYRPSDSDRTAINASERCWNFLPTGLRSGKCLECIHVVASERRVMNVVEGYVSCYVGGKSKVWPTW